MDKKGRIFGVISIIDLLVVIVAIFIVFSLSFRKTLPITSEEPQQDIYYQAIIRQIPYYEAEMLEVGDMFAITETSGKYRGVITNIETTPGTLLIGFETDGTMSYVEYPETNNVRVTVKASGNIIDGFYALNRVHIVGINCTRNFCTDYVAFSGNISYIGLEPPVDSNFDMDNMTYSVG